MELITLYRTEWYRITANESSIFLLWNFQNEQEKNGTGKIGFIAVLCTNKMQSRRWSVFFSLQFGVTSCVVVVHFFFTFNQEENEYRSDKMIVSRRTMSTQSTFGVERKKMLQPNICALSSVRAQDRIVIAYVRLPRVSRQNVPFLCNYIRVKWSDGTVDAEMVLSVACCAYTSLSFDEYLLLHIAIDFDCANEQKKKEKWNVNSVSHSIWASWKFNSTALANHFPLNLWIFITFFGEKFQLGPPHSISVFELLIEIRRAT